MGDYVLLDSDRLVVQAQLTPFNGNKKLSSVTSLAVKYQGSSFIVAYKAKNVLDFKKILVKEEDGIKTAVSAKQNSFSAYFPDGS